MIKQYRKKPVVIEAIQWTGDNLKECYDFMNKFMYCSEPDYEEKIEIETLEGTLEASIDDYIIKGIQGEFYPCKPNIFKQTYEEIKDKK